MVMTIRLLFSIVAVLAAGCQQREAATQASPDPVARGAYLATIASCGDCHTPLKDSSQGPVPDESLLLSGHPAAFVMPAPPQSAAQPWSWHGARSNTAFAGAWGVSYAINLTPDPETGLGKWTADQFVMAMKTGKHLGSSRPILPPMPWPNVGRMTDADLLAVFAYLRSIPPIVNKVPEASVAAPPT
jgi:hypothetical protein